MGEAARTVPASWGKTFFGQVYEEVGSFLSTVPFKNDLVTDKAKCHQDQAALRFMQTLPGYAFESNCLCHLQLCWVSGTGPAARLALRSAGTWGSEPQGA